MNTIYSGTVGLFGYLIAGCLIKIVGTNNLIVYGLSVVGMCGIGLFWATNTLATVVLTSIYVSLGSICTTAFIGVIVNIFPTSLRLILTKCVSYIVIWTNYYWTYFSQDTGDFIEYDVWPSWCPHWKCYISIFTVRWVSSSIFNGRISHARLVIIFKTETKTYSMNNL